MRGPVFFYVINLGVQSAQRSFAMMRPKRKGITAPIGPRTITNVKIGTLDAFSARSLSYRWRTQQSSLTRPHRIEQIYNPLIADPLGSAVTPERPALIGVEGFARFLFRELLPRIVRRRTLWVRPAFLVAVSALLLFFAFTSRTPPLAVVLEAAVAAAVGALTGVFVVRSTSFAAAGIPGAVRVQGSKTTAAIWIVALALRFAARLFFTTGDPTAQIALNAALVC